MSSPFALARDTRDVVNQLDVLLLSPQDQTDRYREVLRATYRLGATTNSAVAVDYATRARPPLLIVDHDGDWDSAAVCRAAKAAASPPAVLVACSLPQQASDVIDTCDSILLKPFAPNLLSARVGRLLRVRSNALRDKSEVLRERIDVQTAKSRHLNERTQQAARGTNIEWPTTHCPHCEHAGIIMFDYASQRRAWYACRMCRNVWIAKRQE